MALLKYLCVKSKKISTLDVDEQLQEQETPSKQQPRGNYAKFFPVEKALVGKYASEHGLAKAVRYFKEKGLKESTVHDWKKAYKFNLREKQKSTEPGEAVVMSNLEGKKRGRPPLLGTRLDLIL